MPDIKYRDLSFFLLLGYECIDMPGRIPGNRQPHGVDKCKYAVGQDRIRPETLRKRKQVAYNKNIDFKEKYSRTESPGQTSTRF